MSGFRKPQTIKRVTAGSYVDGVWVPGVESTFTIQASVQPLKDDALVNLPEGRRASDTVKLYTSSDLISLDDKGANQQPDKLVWRGEDYEVIAKSVRQMGIIDHYRYYATRTPLGN